MNANTDRKLQEQVLLGRRVEGDRLMLADAVLEAALAGTRHLTAGEREALQASPVTLRRLRTLSLQRRASWKGSHGMLRAAAGAAPLATISTDDGYWTLHFVDAGGSWRVVLVREPGAPMAPDGAVRVTDGAGQEIMRGMLDADGEYEADWPFALAPAAHFQANGAAFAVQAAD